MAITETRMSAARKAAAAFKQGNPKARSVRFDPESRLLITLLETGVLVGVPVSEIQGLSDASNSALAMVSLSPSGYGIRFSRIDVDLYLPALLEGIFGNKAWMSERGRKGGQVTSPAKKSAAKQNGRLGGRPRKVHSDELETV